jgi:voltage-gated potassium channel
MTPSPDSPLALGDIGRVNRKFVIVLALLLVLLVIEVSFDLRGPSAVLTGLSSAAVLFIAMVAATGRKRHQRVVFALLTLAVVFNGLSLAGIHPWRFSTGPATSALFAAYATLRLFKGVVRSPRVNGDVLAGALAAYVMAGMSFALVYSVIDTRWPGSFAMADGRILAFSDLVYFSFVTLLTIGFGDVVPATGPARAMTVLEGLFGVVYTTVVMAALVAVYLGHNASPPLPERKETGFGVAGAERDDDGEASTGGR